MIVHKNKLNILYWNARSIQNKIIQLYSYLEENFIDVCCVNETHLKPDIHLHSHPDYKIYRYDRTDRAMGGVMIIAHRHLKHSLIPIPNTHLIENIGIEIICNRRKIHIFSCYLPGGTRAAEIRQHFANDITCIANRNSTFFALGDFNATNSAWNCTRNNTAGNILLDITNNGQIFLLHPDTHTHFPSDSSREPSTIDLIFTNGHLPISDPTTTPLGSDHAGITFEIELAEEMALNAPALRPNYSKTNWRRFRQIIERNLSGDRF